MTRQITITGEVIDIPAHTTFYTIHLQAIRQQQAKITPIVREIEEQAELEEVFAEPSRYPYLVNLNSKHNNEDCTTFFSLPRELRQSILLQTYDYNILYRKPSAAPEKKHGPHRWVSLMEMVDWHKLRKEHLEYVPDWLSILRDVDPRIVRDVNFVEAKWREGIDGSCDKFAGAR